MGVFKTADGRTLVGIGQQDGNEYSGFAGWRDCVIQLTASGATENSVKYLNAIKDYAIAHNAKGESIMPPNLSIWISNNGATTAVQADDIAVDGANVTICGIKWNGTAWDYTDAGKGSGGFGGASSLADLSDVEIDPSSAADTAPLLRFDSDTQKWTNCNPKIALFGPWYNDGSGAIVLEDDAVKVRIVMPIYINSPTGRAFAQLFQAAITYGQYQADNLDKSMYRALVVDAARATAANSDMPICVLNADQSLFYTYRLVGASSDYAVWSGVILYNSKFYRISFAVICKASAISASIVGKAEELMTYTDPT